MSAHLEVICPPTGDPGADDRGLLTRCLPVGIGVVRRLAVSASYWGWSPYGRTWQPCQAPRGYPAAVDLADIARVHAVTRAAAPVAASGVDIHGGGSTDTMTRFALGIHDSTGHFECLMPGIMTVSATVTRATLTATGASFEGLATITVAAGTPFGNPGRLAVGVPFTGSVVAGGPGVGKEDLKILGMDFPGTLEHGQISIGT